MLVFGIDAHKRTHTIVAIDERGHRVGQRVINATSDDHLTLVAWACQLGDQRLWAVEDCRHLSRRLERDLLCAGERIVRVPTKMMASARKASRGYGKSDPIDALAVARAALAEPDLPAACLDGPARDVRLLVDHREDLVAERTRIVNRLRWHLPRTRPDLGSVSSLRRSGQDRSPNKRQPGRAIWDRRLSGWSAPAALRLPYGGDSSLGGRDR
jgi:transposase